MQSAPWQAEMLCLLCNSLRIILITNRIWGGAAPSLDHAQCHLQEFVAVPSAIVSRKMQQAIAVNALQAHAERKMPL